jgi:hypothetical protein
MLLATMAASTPRSLLAQQLVGFGGLEGRLGVANPKNADAGLEYAVDADLGYLGAPYLRTYAGLAGFSSDVNLSVAGTNVGGSIRGLGLETGLRLDVLPNGTFSPYGLAGLSFTNVSTKDITDPTTDDLLRGFYASFDFGLGLAWRFGTEHVWSAVGDLRYVTGSTVGRTVVTLGLRWSPHGRLTYQPTPWVVEPATARD